jgi:hypothetical protein
MDMLYVALGAVFWLLMVGLTLGCARLKGDTP